MRPSINIVIKYGSRQWASSGKWKELNMLQGQIWLLCDACRTSFLIITSLCDLQNWSIIQEPPHFFALFYSIQRLIFDKSDLLSCPLPKVVLLLPKWALEYSIKQYNKLLKHTLQMFTMQIRRDFFQSLQGKVVNVLGKSPYSLQEKTVNQDFFYSSCLKPYFS